MAKASAHGKTAKGKSKRLSSTTKKAKSKVAAKPSRRSNPAKAHRASNKPKSKGAQKSKKQLKKKTPSPARRSRGAQSAVIEEKSKKSALKSASPSFVSEPPRLLRQTKTTAAAIALLEKGIQLIYKKDFKKARGELNALLEKYPKEIEILARARSYIQICEREETLHKKPPVATDQLYAMGILEHNKANYDSAISYFQQSLEMHPNADYIYYSVAASMAKKGDVAGSLENLRKAVELNEDSRIYAKNDADFSALQTNSEFTELVGLVPSPEAETKF